MNQPLRTAALSALIALGVVQPALAQAPTPGERWRQTMSMEAMGMKMPGMTSEICAPKNEQDAPPVANEDCQVTNQRQSGNTLSFDMQCKDGTTGTMEMTRESPTRWSGKMVANTKDGEMTMRMTNEKLPGECDASAMERKMNRAMANANAQQAKFCLDGASAGTPELFLGPMAVCKDKPSIDAYCSRARTASGYNSVARQQRMAASGVPGVSATSRTAVADTGRLCGFSPETVRTQLCAGAQGKKEWTFFAEECPELAKPLAQRECAGRDFTNPVAPPFQAFCSAYAAAGRSAGAGGASAGAPATGLIDVSEKAPGGDAPGAEEPPKPTDKAKEALQKGRDALKGIFGR